MGEAVRMFNHKEEIEEKDGEDRENFTEGLAVEVVENGWLVRIMDSEGEENLYVYQLKQGAAMMQHIAEALGVNSVT